MPFTHLSEELSSSPRVVARTIQGTLIGARARNGAAVWLEVPYALHPKRFQRPVALPDGFKHDEGNEFVHETRYAYQTDLDLQVEGTPPKDKLGLGKPSENPLFLNIISPPSYPTPARRPVKFFIHGGGLQWGSPHNFNSLPQYVAAAREEVWVNVGYRLSVFGFLASAEADGKDSLPLEGNYGFWDQWTALEWVQNNIEACGGDSNDIQILGFSAGAHSVHQILLHAASLPPSVRAPFQSATLQSNAMLARPPPAAYFTPQHAALRAMLDLPPTSSLRDIPAEDIIAAVERLGAQGTFRACSDGASVSGSGGTPWLADMPSSDLAHVLKEKGVRSIVLGECADEWAVFGRSFAVSCADDVWDALSKWYPPGVIERMKTYYTPASSETAKETDAASEANALLGRVLSDGQVYLPVRRLARVLSQPRFDQSEGLNVLRYEIRWAPRVSRIQDGKEGPGLVSHSSDRPIWMLYEPTLDQDELSTARRWVDAVASLSSLSAEEERTLDDVLVLREDGTIAWEKDRRKEEMDMLEAALGLDAS